MPDLAPGQIQAAGAVLWRAGADGPDVALVHRPRYDDWSFPKGKQLAGEHLLTTAAREVAEETGVRAWLGRRLRPAFYVSEGRAKRVDYWVATPVDTVAFVPGEEVDDLVWLPVAHARDRLSYAHDGEVLAEFAAAPVATVPVVLLRHASAVGKARWRGEGHEDDLARPLTARGRAQARALTGVLSCYPRLDLISSVAERCLATVRPYARAAGAGVDADPGLVPSPEAGEQGAQAARVRVADAVAAGRPALICAHRENLGSLLSWICDELATPAPHVHRLRKGGFWVLQVGAGQLYSVEHHLPPGG